METTLTNYLFAEAHQHIGALWYLAALLVALPLFCALCQMKNKMIRASIAIYGSLIYYHNIEAAVTADYPRVILRLCAGLCMGVLIHEIVKQIEKSSIFDKNSKYSLLTIMGVLVLFVPLIMSFLQIQNRRIPLLCEFVGLTLIIFSEEKGHGFCNKLSIMLGKLSMANFILSWSVGELIRWALPNLDIRYRVVIYFVSTFFIAGIMLKIIRKRETVKH